MINVVSCLDSLEVRVLVLAFVRVWVEGCGLFGGTRDEGKLTAAGVGSKIAKIDNYEQEGAEEYSLLIGRVRT